MGNNQTQEETIKHMGSKCSKETFTGNCTCFANDTIDSVDIVRYITADWVWSKTHDAALVETLSNYTEQVPKDIMYLVKDHAFNESEPHSVMLPMIRQEKRCCKSKQLLRKKLCPHWYLKNNLKTETLNIALHVSDVIERQKIFEIMCAETLPSLQLQSESELYLNKYEQINRVMLMDQVPIRLRTISIEKEDVIDNALCAVPSVHIVIVNESDSIYHANKTCKTLWNKYNSMKNCILVRVTENTRSSNMKAIETLANYLNIPCFTVSFNKPKTIYDLFCFAVKYYWFCSVVK